MRNLLPILTAVCCATAALAQPATRTTTTASYQRVSTVVGTTFTIGSTTVGKVTEVVINDGGCIEYLVVQETEGFVVVPWSVVTVNYEQKTVTTRLTTVTVENLRELRFTGDRWPDFADQAFVQRVQTVWGAGAIRSGTGTTTPDRKGTGTTVPDKGTKDRTDPKDPKAIPPVDPRDPKTKEPPVRPRPKDPTREDPPVKEPPKKDDPKKDKKDPDRS